MTTKSQIKRFCILGMALAVVYCLLVGIYYMSDPLAQAPQLDAKENLILATQFSENTEIEEPFYRAVLYPYILSLFSSESSRPIFGLFLGLICHLANGYLVWKIAEFIWKFTLSGAISAGLYLINPASLFYSLQLMDITLGITLFLSAIYLAITGRSVSKYLISGLLLGLCVATRPHFLPVAVFVPLIALGFNKQRNLFPVLIYCSFSFVLILQGLINLNLSGEFRILPWQGAYNLYAANRPGANGLYYKQTLDVSGNNYTNPARAESEILFQRETGKVPPFDISEFNDFWNKMVIREFIDSPLGTLKLCLYKTYAVINSYEQYNNLTFSYHKARLPLFRFNPVNWGILLIFATLGLLLLYIQERKFAIGILLLIIGYGISLVLYYASARFRLPLVPFLAILSGGCAFSFQYLLGRRRYLAFSLCLVMGIITFSSIGGIDDKGTYIQDDLLLANANADLGNDMEAASHAVAVLTKQPQRAEALRVYAISYFNMRLVGNEAVQALGSWEDQKKWVVQSVPTDPIQDAILGVYFWNWGQQTKAVEIWSSIEQKRIPESSLSKACLIAAGQLPYDPGLKELSAALKNILN